MADFTSQIIRKAGTWTGAFAQCVLTYEERFLRRKVIKTAQGKTLLVDLAHTVSLDHGDAFELPDLSLIEVTAAEEPLLQITGDLVQLAWHIATACCCAGVRGTMSGVGTPPITSCIG